MAFSKKEKKSFFAGLFLGRKSKKKNVNSSFSLKAKKNKKNKKAQSAMPDKATYHKKVDNAVNKMLNDLLKKGLDKDSAWEQTYYFYKDDIRARERNDDVTLFTMLPEYQAGAKKDLDRILKK